MIAANKLPENAGWDKPLLAAMQDAAFDVSLIGFSCRELARPWRCTKKRLHARRQPHMAT